MTLTVVVLPGKRSRLLGTICKTVTAFTMTSSVAPVLVRTSAVPFLCAIKFPAASMVTTLGSELQRRSAANVLPTAIGGVIGASNDTTLNVDSRKATNRRTLCEDSADATARSAGFGCGRSHEPPASASTAAHV